MTIPLQEKLSSARKATRPGLYWHHFSGMHPIKIVENLAWLNFAANNSLNQFGFVPVPIQPVLLQHVSQIGEHDAVVVHQSSIVRPLQLLSSIITPNHRYHFG